MLLASPLLGLFCTGLSVPSWVVLCETLDLLVVILIPPWLKLGLLVVINGSRLATFGLLVGFGRRVVSLGLLVVGLGFLVVSLGLLVVVSGVC